MRTFASYGDGMVADVTAMTQVSRQPPPTLVKYVLVYPTQEIS